MSQHFALFGVHGFSAGGDIMYLICHVISHDDLTNVSSHLAEFGGHSQSGSGVMNLVCHVISQDHVIKGSCDLLGGSPLS